MKIIVRCPECGISISVPRIITDPSEAASVEIICQKCDDGDIYESVYFDKDGNYIRKDKS